MTSSSCIPSSRRRSSRACASAISWGVGWSRTVPRVPSITTMVPGSMRSVAPVTPNTAGIPIELDGESRRELLRHNDRGLVNALPQLVRPAVHEVLDHPDRDARQVHQPILEARAPGRGPHVADLERLELVRLLGREVVLANQVRDAGEKLLVLEHQDLRIENARLVHPGAILGLHPQILEVALHVLHRGAQAAHLFLHLCARHDAVRHLGHGPAHHDRLADTDPRRDPDALELPVAHSLPSASRWSASRSSAARRSSVRCISWNPSATSASSASMADSASAPSTLMVRNDPHSAASIITPMILFPFTARSSLRTSTADLKRLASFTNSAAGRACIPSGLTILASRSITAIATPPAPRRRAWPGRAARR